MSSPDYPEDYANPYDAPGTAKPRPPERPDLVFNGPTQVRFAAIGEAWDTCATNRGTWALMGLSIYGCAIVVWIVFGALSILPDGGGRNDALTLVKALLLLGILPVTWFGQAYLMAGMFRAACRQARGERIQVSDLFAAGDVTWDFFLGTVLVGICTSLGLMLCVIPGLIIAGRLMLVFPLIADGRMRATDAIATSWRALRGQSLSAFAFQFVVGILASVGSCLCGIGLLLTFPIYFLAPAIVYRDYFSFKPRSPSSTDWPELA